MSCAFWESINGTGANALDVIKELQNICIILSDVHVPYAVLSFMSGNIQIVQSEEELIP